MMGEKNMVASVSSSMLKILKSFLLGQKDKEITPSEAEKIQKAAYALNNADIKKRFTPPYLSMVSGLDSKEKQLFEATVYYLTKIAIKKSKYREDILNLLKEKSLSKGLSSDFKECIKQNIQKISLKNNL